ncbi:olfactory receptor 1f45-like [Pelodiscus sinensis]|uniref:olfactory receptor 1f45-like n=1 Tax=Pelodiscus sinensis TaxID=13735 RepID=UPI003F6CBE04
MKSAPTIHKRNQTSTSEFILLGFGEHAELQFFLFLLFLVIYMVTVAGNLLIMALIVVDPHLHTPMYFFLGNLSCLETCYSSAILPRLLASLLTGDRSISVTGCLVQLYFFGSLVDTECYLLAVMSYDRYLAICKPLYYSTQMSKRFCLWLAAGSWISAFLAVIVVIVLLSQLIFCGPNEMDHFFCDLTPMIKLSCSDTRKMELVTYVGSILFTLPPFLLTLTSYIYIIMAILHIPSPDGKQKAFSTCSSHLIVVSVFYGTLIVVYLLPKTEMLRELNKVFSLCYTVVTPLLNPLVYSLRNKDVKVAFRKAIGKWVAFANS